MGRNRTEEERRLLKERVRQIAKRERLMPPAEMARVLGMSHVTVRKYLRELKLYVPRGGGGVLL